MSLLSQISVVIASLNSHPATYLDTNLIYNASNFSPFDSSGLVSSRLLRNLPRQACQDSGWELCPGAYGCCQTQAQCCVIGKFTFGHSFFDNNLTGSRITEVVAE